MSFPSRRLLSASASVACAAIVLATVPGSEALGHGDSTPAAAASPSTTLATPRAKPPVRLPAHPKGLEAPGDLDSDVDESASYQAQLSCAAKALPGTLKLRALTLSTYGRGGTSPATPRACSSGGASEHKDGRAWDWMVDHSNTADRKAAADFLSWLTRTGPSGDPAEMASRLGVMYVIYNRKIWSSYSPGWRSYTGYDSHTSHIHISLSWNGARGHTSFWTDRVWATDYGVCQVFDGQPAVVAGKHARTRPCESASKSPLGSSRPLGWLGSTGSAVTDGQRMLGVATTGTFDAATRNAVLDYQRSHDLPRTGALDKPTWASLDPASASRSVPRWTPVKAAAWARDNGSHSVRRGDAGKLVYALQIALRMDQPTRNGYYGRATRDAVVAFKRDAGLPRTALVDADVWALLPAS